MCRYSPVVSLFIYERRTRNTISGGMPMEQLSLFDFCKPLEPEKLVTIPETIHQELVTVMATAIVHVYKRNGEYDETNKRTE
jgi:hypothetical protein